MYKSGDHMIWWLIERMAIIDHHDNKNWSINRLNHNRFTALVLCDASFEGARVMCMWTIMLFERGW